MGEVLRGRRDRASLVDAAAGTPARLAALLAGLDDPGLDATAEGEWSVRTVAAHLRDDEHLVMRLRIERMLAEDAPVLTPFDEKRWAGERARGRDEPAAILEDFALQRTATAALLRRLGDSEWRRTGSQPEIGTFDVHWWVEHLLEHDETHLAQIEARIEAIRRA